MEVRLMLPTMPIRKYSFDTDAYIVAQVRHIQEKIVAYSGPTYIEFGGKPFGDMHAARVLPGYHKDCKAQILHDLGIVAKIIMVVNARDILPEPIGRYPNGRIRGDSGLRYHQETMRLAREALDLGVPIDAAVLSLTPRLLNGDDRERIEAFRLSLNDQGIELYRHFEIGNYPDPSILDKDNAVFDENDIIAEPGKHLVVFSPGGGSGKFGVMLSEMYYAFKRGEIPNFVKFETFPVFTLPENHPLNMAFEAATADLRNQVITLHGGFTTYDKDIENFRLLKSLYGSAGVSPFHPVSNMTHPTDMGVNIIDQMIRDMNEVIDACGVEIARRCERYRREYAIGENKLSTLTRAMSILQEYRQNYAVILPQAVGIRAKHLSLF
jgi:uncharacterized protein (UPF0371 family)